MKQSPCRRSPRSSEVAPVDDEKKTLLQSCRHTTTRGGPRGLILVPPLNVVLCAYIPLSDQWSRLELKCFAHTLLFSHSVFHSPRFVYERSIRLRHVGVQGLRTILSLHARFAEWGLLSGDSVFPVAGRVINPSVLWRWLPLSVTPFFS